MLLRFESSNLFVNRPESSRKLSKRSVLKQCLSRTTVEFGAIKQAIVGDESQRQCGAFELLINAGFMFT